MKLTPVQKCLWRYLTERCDQSGVWEPNWSLASIYIGVPVSEKDLAPLSAHIEVLSNKKIFIPDFVDFQYGSLSEKSPAHKPVFRAIEKNNLSNRVFSRVSNTLQEKEKEKEKEVVLEKEKEKEKEKEVYTKSDIEKSLFTDEEYVSDLKRMNPGKDLHHAFDQCWIHYSALPTKLHDWEWRQKLNTWLGNMKNGSVKGKVDYKIGNH